jgi:uncharacterized membrane protein YqjE
MARSVEVSGTSLLYVFNVLSIGVLVAVLSAATWPPDPASVGLAVLVGVLLAATIVGAWRRRTDRDDEHLGTEEDVAYDRSPTPDTRPRIRGG